MRHWCCSYPELAGQLLSLPGGEGGAAGRLAPQVRPGPHQYDGGLGPGLPHLTPPLGAGVAGGGGGDHAVAEQEDGGAGVGQRPQPVVLLLPGGVEQRQLNRPPVHLQSVSNAEPRI